MIVTVLSLIGLGLAMSFSPTTYALQVTVLSRAEHPVRAGHVIIAGVLTGAALMVLLLQIVNPDAWAALLSGRVQEVLIQRWFDIAAGALFVVVGLRLMTRRRTPDRPARDREPTQLLDSTRAMFVFAAGNIVLSVGGAATTYVALRLVREAHGDLLLQLAGIAVFFAAIAAPYVALLWSLDRIPRLQKRAAGISSWLRAQPWQRIGGIALVVLGGVLVGAALTNWYGAG